MPRTRNKVKKQVANIPQVIKTIIAVPKRLGCGIGPFKEHGETKDEERKEQAKDKMTTLHNLYFLLIIHNQSLLQASFFKIGQELYLIIEIIEQHTWTQLVICDCFVVDHVSLSILLESDRLVDRVHDSLDDITFSKLECLYAVVMLSLGVAPTSSVCTDHISSMSDRAEIKTVVLTCDHFRVTHSNCNPI